MSINQRLKDYIDHIRLSQRDLGIELGVPETSVSKWFKQNMDIPPRHIIKVFLLHEGLSPRWLLKSKGSMLEVQIADSGSELITPAGEEKLIDKLMEANQLIGALKSEIKLLKIENKKLSSK